MKANPKSPKKVLCERPVRDFKPYRTQRRRYAYLLLAALAMMIAAAGANAQYPDTLWIPVTYYDFHADKSNPEFQPKDMSVGGSGYMVESTLDADRKPVWGGRTDKGMNRYMKYWYRSWADSARGDSTMPVYEESGNNEDLDYIADVNHDTAFINLTFHDSLPFKHIGEGVYEYKDDSFFPLDEPPYDALSYGPDHKTDTGHRHNYAFTMELHTTFVMKPGITFNFTGDDDVFAFVNNQLAMDIGGIHGARTDSFNADDLSLTPGEEYAFDFFFAERHTTGSHIWITTNIISTNLVSVNLKAEPDDTIQAGETVTAWAEVVDDTGGVHAGYGDLINWSFVESGGNDDSTLSGHSGDTIYFVPTEAYSLVKIQGTLLDTFSGDYLRDTIDLYVLPGPADHLTIEGSPTVTGAGLRDDQEIAGITIGAAEVSKNAFAIIRDVYGNFVENSNPTSWSIVSGQQYLDSVAAGTAADGEGIAYKQGDAGTAVIAATSGQYSGAAFTDNLNVTISPVDYTELRITVNDRGTFRTITDLTMTTDQCTLLIVEGRRSDGKGWDAVDGNWTSTLPSTDNPPFSSQTFEFCPTDTGSGNIRASYLDAPQASIDVRVNPGGPASMALYPSAGAPSQQTPYDNPPVFYFVNAGEPFDIYANVFDKNHYWLRQYENASAPISWQMDGGDGPTPGSLSAQSGYHTAFTPTIAYRTVRITATFNENGRTFVDEVLVKTRPGDPYRLSIQADTATINGTDLQQITLSPVDTLKSVYAVIKDRYDNYISYAELADWTSEDTSIVEARQGEAIFSGEGELLRRSDSTQQALVIATSNDDQFSDTLRVTVSQITYTDLQIAVYENTFVNIDTLTIRTDQDTTLYARGKRSDTGRWVDLAVAWTGPASLRISPSAPPSDDAWRLSPGHIGSGAITATGPGDISDQIVIIAEHGLANRLTLYRTEQPPTQSQRFPDPGTVDTVAAGDTLLLAGNVFDHLDVWLEEYRSAPENGSISWRVIEQGSATGTGALTATSGATTRFVPRVAYRTVLIVATLRETNQVFRDTAAVAVTHGPPHHLVIEASSQISSYNADDPVSQIQFSPRDTAQAAYAILRDAFGNFAGHSRQTDWISLDSSIVSAQEGVTIYGEGRMFRQAEGGQTDVVAQSRQHPGLLDTVEVVLTDIYYDSLRIVISPEQRIEQLVLQTGYDTTLFVEGKRSDNGLWQPVAADWHIAPQLTVTPPPPAQSPSWTFSPEQDGAGLLHVTLGTSVPDTIQAIFDPGDPVTLRLYGYAGAPAAGNEPLPDPSSEIDIQAGEAFDLYAKLFDKNDRWLDVYESEDSAAVIQWSIIENAGNAKTGTLDAAEGFHSVFTPTVAYRTVQVAARAGASLADTVTFNILPGEPHHIVIEGSQDRDVSPNADNPIDTIVITSLDTLSSVYAIVRDTFENFVNHSKVTIWSSANSDIVDVENGNANIGEGFVIRRANGLTQISAQNDETIDLAIDADDAYVHVLAYYYTDLRISIENSDADTLAITTNDSAGLTVEGKRSSDGEWEPVASRWEIVDNLHVSPAAPENSNFWRFSPDSPGEGWIRAYMNDANTTPDTLPVVFERGKPVEVEIDILTPADERIAGDTITTVVRIRNTNGLVPGTWCYPLNGDNEAIYGDTLGNGGRDNDPIVIVDDSSYAIDDKTASAEQCFEDGIDTVKYVLFYAPVKQTPHVLTVDLDGVAAESEPIVLLPGALERLTLETADGEQVDDTVTLAHPEGAATIRSIGFDAYGNRIGQVASDWEVDGSLHPIEHGGRNSPQIYYSAADVTDFEQGRLSAVARDSIEASAYIKIIGPGVSVREAFTRDLDGDGLLDAIEFRFDKAVALPSSFYDPESVSNHFGIAHTSQPFTEFIADSVSGSAGETDTSYFVYFTEDGGEEPQTNWRLTLTIRETGDTINELNDSLVQDGAGPVIWDVRKYADRGGNHEEDKVVVVFSEPVVDTNGSPLSAGMHPADLFQVWIRNEDSTYTRVDSMLAGIDGHAAVSPDSVQFHMENGRNLLGLHYFSFIADSGLIAADDNGKNEPSSVNRKTRVQVIGTYGDIVIGPNPISPTKVYRRSELEYVEPERARNIVKNSGGAALSIEIIIDNETANEKVTGQLLIFDAIGNPVYVRESRGNLMPPEWREISYREEGESRQLTFVWNGITDDGKKSAPGIYRAVLFIDFGGEQRKFVGNVGVGR